MAKLIRLQSGINNITFGENVKVVEPVNLYGCAIGNDTFVGPFVEIQKEVTIGNNYKIESHSFICELVTIRNNFFIGHGLCLLMMCSQRAALQAVINNIIKKQLYVIM